MSDTQSHLAPALSRSYRIHRGGWGLYQNKIAFPAAEQRSDVWVMEVKAP